MYLVFLLYIHCIIYIGNCVIPYFNKNAPYLTENLKNLNRTVNFVTHFLTQLYKSGLMLRVGLSQEVEQVDL